MLVTDKLTYVWARRQTLDNWSSHVHAVRTDERREDPCHVHEVAEAAMALARSLVKYVAIPEAVDLTVAEVLTLASWVADPKVPA